MKSLYRIFLHCENGIRIPCQANTTIDRIVSVHLDKPFHYTVYNLNGESSDKTAICRSIEFLDSVHVHLCGKDFRLVRIYSLKDSYLKKNNLLSKFRVTLEETRHFSVCTMKYKEDAAYIPGMFDPN